jgi:hypothetical protein
MDTFSHRTYRSSRTFANLKLLKMTLFGPIRESALEYWSNKTRRTVTNAEGTYNLTDSYQGAYECDWQNNSGTGHVNLFCSLGDWGCNLSDMLKDTRYDTFDLDDTEQGQVIYRYFTRIMLIVSELLTDFQDIYIKAKNFTGNAANQKARSFYFPRDNRITTILNYINRTCKHKTNNIHVCNNHFPIVFEDSVKRRSRNFSYLSMSNSVTTGKTAILVPKLEFLVISIVHCYRKLNNYFKTNKAEFNALCTHFT